jgi:hypothetical protein
VAGEATVVTVSQNVTFCVTRCWALSSVHGHGTGSSRGRESKGLCEPYALPILIAECPHNILSRCSSLDSVTARRVAAYRYILAR